MKRGLVLFLIGLLLVIGVSGWLQHAHFQNVRVKAAQDRQPALYDRESFHVLTFIRTGELDLVDRLQALNGVIEVGALIYAGKAIANTPSEQIDRVAWSGVLLYQYPSQKAFEAERIAPAYGAVLDQFEDSYEVGMDRPAALNLLLPQMLLAQKTWRAVTFTESPYPFEPTFDDLSPEDFIEIPSLAGTVPPAQAMEILERLTEESLGLGRDALLVVNVVCRGTAQQQASDAEYTSAMFGLMAERSYGPIHIGDAVPMAPDHSFDDIAIVYYPGSAYFRDLITSHFFQSIRPDKQLGDFQATITVPITDLVDP